MIARGIFRLVAGFVLLIQNHHAQIVQRGKDSTAGTKDHIHLAPADPLPLIVALTDPEPAVEHDHLLPEVGRKSCHHLRREGNLRHQDHSTPSPADDLLEQSDIHCRLSAAGDTVEKGAGGLFLRCQSHNAVECRLLLL